MNTNKEFVLGQPIGERECLFPSTNLFFRLPADKSEWLVCVVIGHSREMASDPVSISIPLDLARHMGIHGVCSGGVIIKACRTSLYHAIKPMTEEEALGRLKELGATMHWHKEMQSGRHVNGETLAKVVAEL